MLFKNFINTLFSWRRRVNYLYDKLLPASCMLCGVTANTPYNLCTKCRLELPILPHSCRQCGLFLPALPNDHLKCGACLTNPPPFNQTYVLFPYEEPIIQFITKLKFQHQLCYAKLLGELLAQQLESVWYVNRPLPELVIPIPLHAKRLRERGFNQALEIVKPAAKRHHLTVDFHGIKRIKHTKAQSSLPAAERKLNIANAFKISRDYTGLTLAVIDDVITTGHTMTEFCKILKQQGVKHIDVWCCARRG